MEDDIFLPGDEQDAPVVPPAEPILAEETSDTFSEDVMTPDTPQDITPVSAQEADDVLFDDVMTPLVETEIDPSPRPRVSLRERIHQTKSVLDRCGIPDMLLLRVIAMYFFAFAWQIHTLRKDRGILPIANWQDFVGEISLGSIALMVLTGVMTLSVIHYLLPKRYRVADPLAAIAAMISFDIALLWKQGDAYLSIGVTLVSLVVVGYALGKLRSHRLFDKWHWSVCGVLVLAMAILSTAFIAVLTIYRHRVFGSMAHDFGLFAQMFHSLADNLTAVTTMERDVLMSHFEVHSSYIYYVLVPFFKLFPYEETLLVAQGVLAMGGVVPLFLIAKRRNFKGLSLIFIGAMYAFCSAFIGPCFYDFHENAFLPTLLMWTLWAVDGKKTVPFYVFSVLTCLVKEDAPLYIICIGLYWFFEQKGTWKRLHGMIAAAGAGIYMLRITAWLMEHGDGSMMTSSRFGHLLIDPEGGLVEVVTNSLSNPGYLFSLLIQEGTLVFFVRLMLPLLFLPLFTKKIRRFLLLVPFIVSNLVIGAKYGYAANMDFQYVFGPAAMLLFVTVLNTSDFSKRVKKDIPILLGCAAFIMSMGTLSHNLNKLSDYEANAPYFQALEETLDSLPEDAVIAGNPFLIPHLSDRDEVYIFDMSDIDQDTNTLKAPDKYDFIVLTSGENACLTAEPLLGEAGYVKLKTDISERITIFMSPHYEMK